MLQSVQRLARVASGAIGRESWLIRQLRPAYESTLQVLSGARGVPWEINGVTFRIDPRCRAQLGSVWPRQTLPRSTLLGSHA